MVRLVFRPYTQIRPLICTSKPLRASIRVSSDFALFRHSSPSFGSQHIRSYSVLKDGHLLRQDSLSFRPKLFLLFRTRIHVRLLGPCFKTGRQVWLPNKNWKETGAIKGPQPGNTCANKDCLLRTIPYQHQPLGP
jgi:hypothetical protein